MKNLNPTEPPTVFSLLVEKSLKNVDKIDLQGWHDLLSPINLDHLSSCTCCAHIVDHYKKIELADMEARNKEENIKDLHTLESRREAADRRARLQTVEGCQSRNIRCPYEAREVRKTLALFYGDIGEDALKDPEAVIIVRSVINHQLSAFRLARASLDEGPLVRMVDRDGNSYMTVNPAEEAKRRFDDSIIDAMSKIHQIRKGTKVVVSGGLTLKDVMADILSDGKVITADVKDEIPDAPNNDNEVQ